MRTLQVASLNCAGGKPALDSSGLAARLRVQTSEAGATPGGCVVVAWQEFTDELQPFVPDSTAYARRLSSEWYPLITRLSRSRGEGLALWSTNPIVSPWIRESEESPERSSILDLPVGTVTPDPSDPGAIVIRSSLLNFEGTFSPATIARDRDSEPRIAQFSMLLDCETGAHVALLINTHLSTLNRERSDRGGNRLPDAAGDLVRYLQLHSIADAALALVASERVPVVVVGDFNAEPSYGSLRYLCETLCLLPALSGIQCQNCHADRFDQAAGCRECGSPVATHKDVGLVVDNILYPDTSSEFWRNIRPHLRLSRVRVIDTQDYTDHNEVVADFEVIMEDLNV